MTAETRQIVEAELKRFAADLNLSDAQKAQMKTALRPRARSWTRRARRTRTSRGPMYSRSSLPSVALCASVW